MAIEALLDHTIAESPAVAALMREARREWPVRVEKDFSFGARAYAGDRWLLVGDAGSFLDPVFSTGVAIALESGVEAGRALDRALATGDLSARSFATFERRQRQRYRAFRRFVLGFYTRGFRDLFFLARPMTLLVPGRGHVAGRLLAALAVRARMAGVLLPARAPPGADPGRAEDPGGGHRPRARARRSS